MTKTLSLPVCRKLSEMGIEVESYFYHTLFQNRELGIEKYDGIHHDFREMWHGGARWVKVAPAYSLEELPAVLRAIGEKKGWKKYVWTSYKEWNELDLKHYTDSEEYDPPFGERCPYAQFHITTEYHFMLICQKFFESGSLGEGSEASKYLKSLL